MPDPFADSSDPDIPTPTRNDLLPHVHGSVRHQLAAGTLDARHAQNEWEGARRIWNERHKEAANKRRQQRELQIAVLSGADELWWGHFYIGHLSQEERNRIKSGEWQSREIEMLAKGEDPWEHSRKPLPAGLEPPASLPPVEEWVRNVIDRFAPMSERMRKSAAEAERRIIGEAKAVLSDQELEDTRPIVTGIRVPGQSRDYKPAPEEKRRRELLEFMPKPLRAEYDKANEQRKAILWEANERNFDAAEKREQERLREYQNKIEKALDAWHRLKEDPSKAHLLPRDDASMDDLHKWHDDISKPDRKVPFPSEGGRADLDKATPSPRRDPTPAQLPHRPTETPPSAMEICPEPFKALEENSTPKRNPEAPAGAFLGWINSPRLRRFERWLWRKPRVAWFLLVLIVAFISFPQWGSAIWYLFESDPPIPTIAKKMNLGFQWLHWSASWVTVPLGTVMFAALFYLVYRGKRLSESSATQQDMLVIARRLKEYQQAGEKILTRCVREKVPPVAHMIRWEEEVEAYLKENLDEFRAIEFTKSAPITVYPNEALNRNLTNKLYTQIERIGNIISELRLS